VFVLALAVLACAEEKKEDQQSAVPAEKKQDKRGIYGLGYGAAPALSYAAPALSYAAPALAHAPAISYAAPALAHAPAISYAAPAVRYAAPAAVSTPSSSLFTFNFLYLLIDVKMAFEKYSEFYAPWYQNNTRRFEVLTAVAMKSSISSGL
jgi:hypothetical protein